MSEPPVTIRIELIRREEPMHGTVHAGEQVEPFTGWLDLLRVLGDALDPESPPDSGHPP